MVRISHDEYGETTDLDTSGQSLDSCGLRVDPVETALWGYSVEHIAGQNRENPNHALL